MKNKISEVNASWQRLFNRASHKKSQYNFSSFKGHTTLRLFSRKIFYATSISESSSQQELLFLLVSFPCLPCPKLILLLVILMMILSFRTNVFLLTESLRELRSSDQKRIYFCCSQVQKNVILNQVYEELEAQRRYRWRVAKETPSNTYE